MDANQSRRRAASVGLAKACSIPLPPTALKFQYQPLDPSVDCTRLLEFELAEDWHHAPRCKLIHVTFGEKPKYEALSYMWGDQTTQKSIFVDGKEFLVGENLWDALRYLKKRVNGQRYWIDAICINQADIPERNRQLRIMPHIYERAQTVLVWLGKKYTTYKGDYFQEILLPTTLGEKLYCDDYWDRVWIVQEIGKARKIQVCLREGMVVWDVFIEWIKKSFPERFVGDNNGKAGPLNLEKQLQEKYRRGHTFRELLENYQNSVCQDPRDKIYGFVGLAVDARGFPMNYQKSLWEVWKDTMGFANKHRMFSSGTDIIRFGRLVKRLLGGSSVMTNDVLARESAFWSRSPVVDEQDCFNLSAYVAGMVICVGPSPEEILSKLDAEDEWREQIQRNFPTDLGNAYRDNDSLMQMLLDSEIDDSDDSNLSSFLNLDIRWKSTETLESLIADLIKESDKIEQLRVTEVSMPEKEETESSENMPTTVLAPESCLYQIKRLTVQNSPWKMGIAAEAVRNGDLICRIPEVEKAVIIRGYWKCSTIIGTVAVPKEFSEEVQAGGDTKYFKPDEEVELGVDVETLHVLMEL